MPAFLFFRRFFSRASRGAEPSAAARTARRRERRELVPVGAAFSVPFLAGQKGDISTGPIDRMTTQRRGEYSTGPFVKPHREGRMPSCTAIPDRVPEDGTLRKTGRRRWPMRLATSTTGRTSRQPATRIGSGPFQAAKPFCCVRRTPGALPRYGRSASLVWSILGPSKWTSGLVSISMY